jgi:4-hydroxy-2-oxoheptanedioate aldolase
VESALVAITAAEKRNLTPFVRIKDSTRPSVLKMLDIGAKGLIVPNVETVEEVKKLVEFAKYAPLGRRGFAPTVATGFGFDEFARDIGEYFALANRETLLIPQCETLGCLENIEAIAAMPGVDGIFVGPYDLSIALGVPAQLDSPKLTEAIRHVQTVCKARNKISMIYANTPAVSASHFENGFDCVACGLDSKFLISAVKDMVAAIRNKTEGGIR